MCDSQSLHIWWCKQIWNEGQKDSILGEKKTNLSSKEKYKKHAEKTYAQII